MRRRRAFGKNCKKVIRSDMDHNSDEWKIKVVGRRQGFDTSPEAAAEWLRTIHKLRGHTGVCPKGVYRFKTFEEAEQWKIKMLARSSLAARHSKT